MGLAWIDLVPGADAEAALAAFHSDAALVELPGGRCRLEAVADDNYGQLADLVVWLAEDTGLVSHAFVTLDHDEYGAENIVLDAGDGVVRRAYHYFVYPRSEVTGEYYTEGGPGALVSVPVIEAPAPGVDPGVLADGPVARGTIASGTACRWRRSTMPRQRTRRPTGRAAPSAARVPTGSTRSA